MDYRVKIPSAQDAWQTMFKGTLAECKAWVRDCRPFRWTIAPVEWRDPNFWTSRTDDQLWELRNMAVETGNDTIFDKAVAQLAAREIEH